MCDAEKRDFGTRLVAKDEETVRVELRLGSSWPTNVELTAWALEGKESMAIERRTFSIDFDKEEWPRIVGNEPCTRVAWRNGVSASLVQAERRW